MGVLPRGFRVVSLAVLMLGAVSGWAEEEVAAAGAGSEEEVWELVYVRTLPGEQERYLRFIELNWAPARDTARELGAVASYRVLVRNPVPETAPPPSAPAAAEPPAEEAAEAEWDVLLITVYSDPDSYQRREEIFAEIFKDPKHARKLVDGKGPRDFGTPLRGETFTSPPDLAAP